MPLVTFIELPDPHQGSHGIRFDLGAGPRSSTSVFRAQARLADSEGTDIDRLRDALQAIAADVMVELSFED